MQTPKAAKKTASKVNSKVLCRTPTPGKKPIRIDKWKYDAVRAALLKTIPNSAKGIGFWDLPKLVEKRLSATALKELGSVMWYTTVVKLDMECRGELERIEGSTPQRLRRKA